MNNCMAIKILTIVVLTILVHVLIIDAFIFKSSIHVYFIGNSICWIWNPKFQLRIVSCPVAGFLG